MYVHIIIIPRLRHSPIRYYAFKHVSPFSRFHVDFHRDKNHNRGAGNPPAVKRPRARGKAALCEGQTSRKTKWIPKRRGLRFYDGGIEWNFRTVLRRTLHAVWNDALTLPRHVYSALSKSVHYQMQCIVNPQVHSTLPPLSISDDYSAAPYLTVSETPGVS